MFFAFLSRSLLTSHSSTPLPNGALGFPKEDPTSPSFAVRFQPTDDLPHATEAEFQLLLVFTQWLSLELLIDEGYRIHSRDQVCPFLV